MESCHHPDHCQYVPVQRWQLWVAPKAVELVNGLVPLFTRKTPCSDDATEIISWRSLNESEAINCYSSILTACFRPSQACRKGHTRTVVLFTDSHKRRVVSALRTSIRGMNVLRVRNLPPRVYTLSSYLSIGHEEC